MNGHRIGKNHFYSPVVKSPGHIAPFQAKAALDPPLRLHFEPQAAATQKKPASPAKVGKNTKVCSLFIPRGINRLFQAVVIQDPCHPAGINMQASPSLNQLFHIGFIDAALGIRCKDDPGGLGGKSVPRAGHILHRSAAGGIRRNDHLGFFQN